MTDLSSKVAQYGLPFVFLNVLGEQLGLPIPAFPTLLVAGALVGLGLHSGPELLAAAVLACLIADTAWYGLGRRYGHRVLSLLCRVSLSPVSCVRHTESLFERWGARSLVAAKFVPGFSTVAPPVAGATRLPAPAFLIYDGLGALIWAGLGIGLGMIFHDAIDRVITYLESLGGWALVIVGAALGVFMFVKWRERKKFYNELRLARIGVQELNGLINDGQAPVVVDVRSPAARRGDPRRIPGALLLDATELERKVPELPSDREIILYCT